MQIQLQLTPRRRKGAVVNRSGPWPFDTAGVTSCSSLPPPLPLHHAAGEAGAPQDDAPGPGIPGRLKSQHPQIPQQEKTINQLFLDGLLMIKALSFPQHCDSDASAFRESSLAAASPACGRALAQTGGSVKQGTALSPTPRAQTALCSQREQIQQPCPSMLPYPPPHR